MEKIINDLVELATKLDNDGYHKFASRIDDVSSSVLQIKTAQYVGVQGYWIRNTRCWSNCYRQKRATSKLGAQQIWEECHKEYVESINNDKSGWEKYANDNSLIKKASVQNEEKKFINSFNAKVASGLNVGDAVFNTINEEVNTYSDSILEKAKDIAVLANTAKENGFDDISIKLAEVSASLVKESQFGGVFNQMWSGAKGLFQGDEGKKISWLNNLEKEVMGGIENIRLKGNNNGFIQLQQKVRAKIPELQNMFGADPKAKELMQAIGVFASSSNIGNRGAAANSLLKAIGAYSTALQQVQQSKQTSQPAKPAKDSPWWTQNYLTNTQNTNTQNPAPAGSAASPAAASTPAQTQTTNTAQPQQNVNTYGLDKAILDGYFKNYRGYTRNYLKKYLPGVFASVNEVYKLAATAKGRKKINMKTFTNNMNLLVDNLRKLGPSGVKQFAKEYGIKLNRNFAKSLPAVQPTPAKQPENSQYSNGYFNLGTTTASSKKKYFKL